MPGLSTTVKCDRINAGTDLPPELAAFASLLDAQPAPVRDAFCYCLALAMVEAGKARLVEIVPGENGPVCVFESSAGERFSLAKPAMSEEAEVKEILEEEGL
jgi:hypothetical protein